MERGEVAREEEERRKYSYKVTSKWFLDIVLADWEFITW